MNFFAPNIFFGFLTLGTIPVILYLLFRRRKRDVPWAATYILRRTLKKQSKVNIWKQYVIVFIRTLAFIALPLVFLRPFQDWKPPGEGAFPRPPSSTHRLILLDLSRSMAASFGSGSCHDTSLSLCRKFLKAGTFPGRLDILSLNGSESLQIYEGLPVPEHEIEELLSKLELSSEPADFESGLRIALREFRASHYKRKEMFVLSDFSARDLGDYMGFAGVTRTLNSQGVNIYCLSYANPKARNFALLDMTPEMDLLLMGQPTIFYLKVAYYGTSPSADTWLSIHTVNGNVLFEDTINLAPGEKTLEIPLALKGNEQTLIAEIKEDDLTQDNQVQRSYRVSDKLRLAVVQNLNMTVGFENPGHWLKLAFPSGGVGAGVAKSVLRQKHIQERLRNRGQAEFIEKFLGDSKPGTKRYQTIVDSVLTSQAGAEFFRGKDGVIFIDVDSITDEVAQALYLYVVRGGTMMLSPGPTATPEKFNESFKLILPAALAEPAADKIDPDNYHHAILDYAGNRLLRELEASKHGHIGNARFYNHYRLADGSLTEDAEVLFSLSDGSPLLVHRKIGRGSCLLWTAGIGGEWHSMVVHPAYPVFFKRMFNLAASRRRFAINLQPGEPIIREMESKRARILFPDGREETLTSNLVGETRYLRYDRTQLPGTYTLFPDLENKEIRISYHVAEDRRESDYRPLAGDNRNEFEELMGSILHPTEEALVNSLGASYQGTSLASQVAFILFCLLLLEAGLLRKWFA